MKPTATDEAEKLPRHFLAPRYLGIWLALGLHALIGRLPRRLRRGFGRWLGEQTYRRKAKRRAIARLNVDWCFPALDEAGRERIARESFHYQGAVLADLGRLWWIRASRFMDNFRIDGEAHLEAARRDGGRVILFTLHTHGMDFGGMALTARYPMLTYVNRMRNPLLEWIVARRRGRFGARIFTREDGMRPAIAALKSGRVFYFPIDEDAHRGEGVFAPFFGVSKYTHTSPFRIAKMTQARLLPCVTYYSEEEGRYIVRILPPLEGVPSGDHAADAARMNAAFEEMIRFAPAQYTWGQRMFQTRPDGQRPY